MKPSMGPIYVVLDGLDKLDGDSVNWLMRQYKSLVDSTGSPERPELKVIVVSQVVDEMQELASKDLCYVVDLAENKDHILGDLESLATENLRAIECAPKIEGENEKRSWSKSFCIHTVTC